MDTIYAILQVAIYRFNTTYHCGGTLVGEQHVISAAHCFSDGAHNYQVGRSGAHNYQVGGTAFTTTR